MSESTTPARDSFYYVYCVADGTLNEKFGKIGIGERGDEVYSYPCKGLTAIVSLTDQSGFDRTEENVLAHQRVIQKIFSRFAAVPLPFSTVLKSDSHLQSFLAARYDEFRSKLGQLEEIGQTTNHDPGRELAEEAIAQSFASALQVRQLISELSTVRKNSNPKPDGNTEGELLNDTKSLRDSAVDELVHEIKNLREELRVFRSVESSNAVKALAADRLEQQINKADATLAAELKQFSDQLQRMKGLKSGIEPVME